MPLRYGRKFVTLNQIAFKQRGPDMPESDVEFIGLPFDLEAVMEIDPNPFVSAGGGRDLGRLHVVVVRARRRSGGTSVPLELLRHLSRFDTTETPPVAPWVDRDNPCLDVPAAAGKQILSTETADGRNYYIAPRNFSFQNLIATSNQIKQESVTAGFGAAGAISAFVLARFAMLVGGGKPFDWKSTGTGARTPNGQIIMTVDHNEPAYLYEPFGNWAYGYFGASLCIPREILLVGGQVAAILDRGSFDQQQDINNINLGIDAFANSYNSAGEGGGEVGPDGQPRSIVAVLLQC